jgi:hypothetical protein
MGMIQALIGCRAYYEHIQDDGSTPSISTKGAKQDYHIILGAFTQV